MKPVVIFVRVCGKPEYEPGAQRWLASYEQYKPAMPHDLWIINRYADAPDNSFDHLGATYIRYDQNGWDCGAWKFAARNIPAPLLVCFNSSCVIRGGGWLERLTRAAERNGKGIYGPLTSLEIAPHVRTPCMAFQPEVMNEYPSEVNTREDTYRFESCGYPDGTPNVTVWAQRRGYATRLVTWDGDYDLPDWRTPAHIFRRGDQSNLMVWDRHCEAYAGSDDFNKAQLARMADGK